MVAVLAAGDLPLTHNLMPAAVNAVLAALERREQRAAAIAAASERLDELYCLSGDLGSGWLRRRSS